MKYSIGFASLDNIAGIEAYTFNVYKRLFFGIFWVPVFTYTDPDREYAYAMCKEFVKENNGELINYDD